MSKILAGLAMLWFLSACTAPATVRSTVANAVDSALVGAEMTTCNDATIGAIRRKYCATQEGCQRWVNYCFSDGSIKSVWNATIKGN